MVDEKQTKRPLSLRGRTFVGVVTSNKMHKSAIVEWHRRIKNSKYDRYQVKRKKIAVHVPEGMAVNVGDMVRIKETRPISKTKNFIITENLGFKKEHVIKKEAEDNADLSIHKKQDEPEEKIEENVGNNLEDT